MHPIGTLVTVDESLRRPEAHFLHVVLARSRDEKGEPTVIVQALNRGSRAKTPTTRPFEVKVARTASLASYGYRIAKLDREAHYLTVRRDPSLPVTAPREWHIGLAGADQFTTIAADLINVIAFPQEIPEAA